MRREFISNLMGLEPINENIQTDFLERLRILNVPKGKLLLSEGEVCDKLWYMKSGLARGFYSLYRTSDEQKEVTGWFAKENSFFNAINSFITQKPSLESIEILEPSLLILISRNDLYYLYDRYPQICKMARHRAEQNWLLSNDRLRNMHLHSAQDRLDAFYRHSKDLFLRVPQKHIASFLGISENYVSKLKSKY